MIWSACSSCRRRPASWNAGCSRAQDSAAVVAERMSRASDEISHYGEYDYIIVNHDIAESVAKVRAILIAERLRRARQVGLTDFVKRLRQGH